MTFQDDVSHQTNTLSDLDTSLLPYPGNITNVTILELGVKITITTIVVVLSLLGNSLVIAVVLRNKRMWTVTNYYIVNLAIADLLVTVSCCWTHTVSSLTEGWILGQLMCKYNSFAQLTSQVSSALTLALIAYDRFFGIVFAMQAHMNSRKARWSLVVVWAIAVSIGLPLLIYRKLYYWTWSDHVEVWCDDDWPLVVTFVANGNSTLTIVTNPSRTAYYSCVSVMLYFLPMSFMIITYSVVILRLRRSHVPLELVNQTSIRHERTKKKVIVMLVVIMSLFGSCWLPYQLVMLYPEHRADKNKQLPAWYPNTRYVALFIAYSNSAINPMIYAWYNDKFRQGFQELIGRRHNGNRNMYPLTYRSQVSSKHSSRLTFV